MKSGISRLFQVKKVYFWGGSGNGSIAAALSQYQFGAFDYIIDSTQTIQNISDVVVLTQRSNRTFRSTQPHKTHLPTLAFAIRTATYER